MRVERNVFLILVLSMAVFSLAWAEEVAWQAEIVRVSDGDTIVVSRHGYDSSEKIRLYGVDCPEKKQVFGEKAKQFVSTMVLGKTVDVRPIRKDFFGRTIAWIYVDGACLNEELLRAGLAWHYGQYSSDRHLIELEARARQQKEGLWSDPHAVAPWDFRRMRK